MVTVKEKTTVTQRIHGNCPTHSRTEISVRDVGTVIDEPKEREGTNMGPTPTETMVAALIACTNVISHKCAKKHGVELKAMTIVMALSSTPCFFAHLWLMTLVQAINAATMVSVGVGPMLVPSRSLGSSMTVPTSRTEISVREWVGQLP